MKRAARPTELRAVAVALLALLVVIAVLVAGKLTDVPGPPAIALAEDLPGADDLPHWAYDDWRTGIAGAPQRIDGPRVELPRAHDVIVRGWAFDPAIPRDDQAVLGIIDDRFYEHVNSELPRPDVAASIGNPAAEHSGYEAPIDTGALGGGTHRFRIAIVARTTGIVHRSPRFVEFTVR